MRPNSSHDQPKTDISLGKSVIGSSPGGVTPVDDDTVDFGLCEFSEKQLVHSVRVVFETDHSFTSAWLTSRLFLIKKYRNLFFFSK